MSITLKDPKKLFGNKIKQMRIEKGWSQEQFAFECDMDRTYIGGVERGERNIALVNICKIAKALKIHPSELLDNQS